MAQFPYLVISPNALLSLIGFLHGPDRTVPTPAEDWREATVDVVIPAHNEEEHIVLCLASVLRQTMKPKRIILIDDGSTDRTFDYAKAFCEENGVELVAVKRAAAIGKTPTIKRQAREFDSDVEFILDGDTILESDNYIARTVQELYQAVGIASACGTILPMRRKDRRPIEQTEPVRRFRAAHPQSAMSPQRSWWHRLEQGLTDMYRDVLYTFLQRFVYRGQMIFFGTMSNPVGCAVAYRRKYIQNLFDHYEPILGDDLTNSEDIFIGFALLSEGYRNIQLDDVYARTQEPQASRLPKQIYLWSSSFFQSCYYFNNLLTSPFKAFRRAVQRRKAKQSGVENKRRVHEPYRQRFGRDWTDRYGRPIGWVLFMSAIEKIGFPAALIAMAALQLWEPLLITIVAESFLALATLALVTRGQRLAYVGKGLLVTPVRYLSIFSDFFTMLRFSFDLWITRNRSWRK